MNGVTKDCIGYSFLGLYEIIHCFVIKLGLDLDNSLFNMRLIFENLEIAVFQTKMSLMGDVTLIAMMISLLLELQWATESSKSMSE